ncbi:hypothetical protein K503DRAFT_870975 [Rhizopogon vinicolor AM-OR11-026]|uniref:Uncharacterized protein n=1 Tax=Rhizopogon vinicolor AM-OR11-026 TaxID=1314800 RepID=A0A1B7MD60_9AGAM|nr:hypothetical protein K503DRAFT_870975 [Rhizopogon vinicolor AM-OR11-026]
MVLMQITWILTTAWETLALVLAVWIAVKHFREVQRPSAGWTVGDCFTILIKTHVFYFASYTAVSSLISLQISLARLLWQRVSFMAFSNLPGACRGLYWDHGSSLEFENIMLTSSPTPTKEPAWLRLFSRSAYTFQLAMVYSREKFVLITLFGALWQAFLEFYAS